LNPETDEVARLFFIFGFSVICFKTRIFSYDSVKVTYAFLSGHFSNGAFLSMIIFSVGLMVTVPAGIRPFAETMHIKRLIFFY
jgi:hypothetical protein